MKDLKVGDIIQCNSAEDAVDTMTELENEGISTDFNFDVPGEYRLEVLKVRNDGKKVK